MVWTRSKEDLTVPLTVDLYYTMRAPYCFLATPELVKLVEEFDLSFELKMVYPLALTDPQFFDRVDPLWLPYAMKDTARIARRLDIPFHLPRPDPIVQDMDTRVVSADQPYIYYLTRLAQAATESGRGLQFVDSVSRLIFSPEVDGWNTGDHLADAIKRAGLDLDELNLAIESEPERLDAVMARNRKNQLAAGHWSTPLFVFEEEVFYGQDRIIDLVWHLKSCGLKARQKQIV